MTTKPPKNLIEESLKEACTFPEYRELVTRLLREGKSTGVTQNDRFLEYTKLNDKRMKRLDKRQKLDEKSIKRVQQVKGSYIWLVLTESWCGDAAHALPVLDRFSKANPNILLQIVSRDENLELMDYFLTNTKRSIPKVVFLDKETLEVLGTWGPYSKPVLQIIADYIAEWGEVDADLKTDLQKWYNADAGKSIEREILEKLDLMP